MLNINNKKKMDKQNIQHLVSQLAAFQMSFYHDGLWAKCSVGQIFIAVPHMSTGVIDKRTSLTRLQYFECL